MKNVVVTDPPRASVDDAARLGAYGVATVHEAAGRVGYLGPRLRPAWPGARIGGTAVTVLCWPGDNLMIHVAIEQCRPGDVLVVATNSPSVDGLFGELFATALHRRGVRGVVLGCGVRDVAELRAMGFPAWSTAVSAQGSVKATPGAVNVPVVVEGRLVRPGDVIVADDDGVVCVPRMDVPAVLELSAARAAKEEASRRAFRAGELGLDRYGLRERLGDFGITYVSHQDYRAEEESRG
ncbi:4-hydroxy-4-methyl-2-oxoglutarate aldolase [Nocardia tenerifensis]|uniref:Putative 4-hydroxy-4-methyl-2-oxoglutarate aldolase n=1 Tax=Nocardia tenerifensis TaxID=228006 RepID=A0A318KH72_9NOCA|nr:4-carboxy-4-hydroxy-2-oxoadipate aldolase/oxaloacetate decarboxylase [Nocardia tenerifensis]PXX71523.1 4-hydroxy-4-methyl-2-oxoglutarate aldolase [Nocardia tenerifensis]